MYNFLSQDFACQASETCALSWKETMFAVEDYAPHKKDLKIRSREQVPRENLDSITYCYLISFL